MPVFDANSAVIEYMRRQWGKTSDIEQENVTSKPAAPYVRNTIIPTINTKVEIGLGGSSKKEAILAIDIFVKIGKGTGVSVELIDAAMALFPAGKTITTDEGKTIRFTAPQELQGLDDGHGFYQSTVHCPFYYYH